MSKSVWQYCYQRLQDEISSKDFNMFIRPLQSLIDNGCLYLYAPNQIVLQTVQKNLLPTIETIQAELPDQTCLPIKLMVGSTPTLRSTTETASVAVNKAPSPSKDNFVNTLNPNFTIDNFIQGPSNEFARAAAIQVGQNPGESYNPLVIYGDVGLGKTHLMHAAGSMILAANPAAKILYVHSERFVTDMVKALQRNGMDQFKQFYRSVDALLIDDIQFLTKKPRSQEEFFHTFNQKLDSGQQIILTSDRYPKELDGFEDRLKSRFSWGLTVNVEPPELETRVAIIIKKAAMSNVNLPQEVGFFIAENIQSNVRELEGALKRVLANAHFMGKAITLDFAKEALKDLMNIHSRLVSIDNIQQTVSRYYKIKISDLTCKSRQRTIARPRQMAMFLCKELTNKSLPEIGKAFGGRDHTTVLHGWKKINLLLKQSTDIKDDYHFLLRQLSN